MGYGDELLAKYNPYHDAQGRFTFPDSANWASIRNKDAVGREKAKYEAKLQRLRDYIAGVRGGTVTPLAFPACVSCPGCGHGRREFQQHCKDLEQLTQEEAEASLMATSRDYRKLVDKEAALTTATTTATTTP